MADVRFVLDSFLIFFARVCNLISYLELRAVCMQKGVLIVSAGFVGIFISEDFNQLGLGLGLMLGNHSLGFGSFFFRHVVSF